MNNAMVSTPMKIVMMDRDDYLAAVRNDPDSQEQPEQLEDENVIDDEIAELRSQILVKTLSGNLNKENNKS
jgi:hypothetical protein